MPWPRCASTIRPSTTAASSTTCSTPTRPSRSGSPRWRRSRASSRPRAVGASFGEEVEMLETAFTRLVGCSVPIQLAGMGSILSPELAAAVSNAGALGQVTFAGIDVADARRRLDRLLLLTSNPFGVNLLIPYLDMEILEMAAPKVRVI